MTFYRWQQVLAALKSEAQVSQYAKHENKNDRLPFKYLGFLDAASWLAKWTVSQWSNISGLRFRPKHWIHIMQVIIRLSKLQKGNLETFLFWEKVIIRPYTYSYLCSCPAASALSHGHHEQGFWCCLLAWHPSNLTLHQNLPNNLVLMDWYDVVPVNKLIAVYMAFVWCWGMEIYIYLNH